jgi:hypothetical protein
MDASLRFRHPRLPRLHERLPHLHEPVPLLRKRHPRLHERLPHLHEPLRLLHVCRPQVGVRLHERPSRLAIRGASLRPSPYRLAGMLPSRPQWGPPDEKLRVAQSAAIARIYGRDRRRRLDRCALRTAIAGGRVHRCTPSASRSWSRRSSRSFSLSFSASEIAFSRSGRGSPPVRSSMSARAA